MIAALARDALRQVLRLRAVAMLVVVGALLGAFAAATRDSGAASLAGVDSSGAAVASLGGGLFLVLLVFAVIAGLNLAAEDVESGLVAQLRTKPVRAGAYAAGRLLGLLLALPIGALAILLPALPLARPPISGLPGPSARLFADRIVVAGRELAPHEVAPLAQGQVARFELDGVAALQRKDRAPLAGTFEIAPQVALGRAFSGHVDLKVRWIQPGGSAREVVHDGLRPLAALPLDLVADASGEESAAALALEIENRSDDCNLEIGRDQVEFRGPARSLWLEIAIAALLALAAAAVFAALSFALRLVLSNGPAALAASFLLLVALGRETVIDIVKSGGGAPREALLALVRAIPDLAAFDRSNALGAGIAVTGAEAASALLHAGAMLLAAAILAAAWLPREESR